MAYLMDWALFGALKQPLIAGKIFAEIWGSLNKVQNGECQEKTRRLDPQERDFGTHLISA